MSPLYNPIVSDIDPHNSLSRLVCTVLIKGNMMNVRFVAFFVTKILPYFSKTIVSDDNISEMYEVIITLNDFNDS